MTGAIALFVYNRPEKTRRVVSQLEQNDVRQDLFVFSDGPKTERDEEAVADVRRIVDGIDYCDARVIERSENVGLSRSILSGIDRVFDEYERLIVLEDDCVPTPDFVSYMTRCLEYYRDHDRVMSVSGYSLPIEIPDTYPYDVYFTHRPNSWGWGTWREEWKKFERLDDFDAVEERSDVRAIAEKGGEELLVGLEKDIAGEIDSWAVWWTWTVLRRGGVSVNPVVSRIQNIGHDGTGVHCPKTDRYDVELPDDPGQTELRYPDDVSIDPDLNRRFNSLMW